MNKERIPLEEGSLVAAFSFYVEKAKQFDVHFTKDLPRHDIY